VLLTKNLLNIADISWQAIIRKHFSEKLIKYFGNFDMFIFNSLSNKISVKDRCRYLGVFMMSLFIWAIPFKTSSLLRTLYRLAVKNPVPDNIII
jgi:hypothetical protein